MRGDDEQSGHLFSYLSPEQRVPVDHPLRAIRTMTDDALHRPYIPSSERRPFAVSTSFIRRSYLTPLLRMFP